MASTSITLGPHWEAFIKHEVESGRYGSASEVIREGLRKLERDRSKLDALREFLAEGIKQADRGEFINQSAADMLKEFADERKSGE